LARRYPKPVWQMIKEAVEALGGSATNKQIRELVLRRYPGTNTSTINCQIIYSTVTRQSPVNTPCAIRLHVPLRHGSSPAVRRRSAKAT